MKNSHQADEVLTGNSSLLCKKFNIKNYKQ